MAPILAMSYSTVMANAWCPRVRRRWCCYDQVGVHAPPARGARNKVKETWQHATCDPLGRRLSVWRDPLPPYRRTRMAGGLSLHRLHAPIGIGVRNESENAQGGC